MTTVQEAGRRGGQSRSSRKQAASRANVALARAIRAEAAKLRKQPERLKEDPMLREWLADSDIALRALEDSNG